MDGWINGWASWIAGWPSPNHVADDGGPKKAEEEEEEDCRSLRITAVAHSPSVVNRPFSWLIKTRPLERNILQHDPFVHYYYHHHPPDHNNVVFLLLL